MSSSSKLGMVLLLLVCVLVITVMTTGQDAKETVLSDKQQAIIALFQSGAEPSIKDAVWAGSDHLRVGMFDNGTKRDGFADYVCQVLYDHGITGVRVTINDIIKITRDNDWVTIGKSNCRYQNK